MTLRPVSFGDLELVCDHRRRMFEAAGRDGATLERMTEGFRPWLASRLRSGEYGGWIAEDDGQAVAAAGERRASGPLEMQVAGTVVGVDEFAQQ